MRPARPTLRTLLATAVVGGRGRTLAPATPAAAVTVKVDKRFFGLHDSDSRAGPGLPGRCGSGTRASPGATSRPRPASTTSAGWTPVRPRERAGRRGDPRPRHDAGLLRHRWSGEPPRCLPISQTGRTTSVPWSRTTAQLSGVRAASVPTRSGTRPTRQASGPARRMQMASSQGPGTRVKTVDRGALVLSPAFAVAHRRADRGIKRFAFAGSDGKPAWRFTDAVSLNLYPLRQVRRDAGHPGEVDGAAGDRRAGDARLRRRAGQQADLEHRDQLRHAHGVGGGSRGPISVERRRPTCCAPTCSTPPTACNGSTGTPRTWATCPTAARSGNTLLTNPANGAAPTLAGRAFGLAQDWLLKGTLVGASTTAQPCAKDSAGTYTCVIRYSGGVRRVYWNPTKKVTVGRPSAPPTRSASTACARR